jgi:hypothetical protein
MDNFERIKRDLRRLPVKVVMRKHGIDKNKARELLGLPPLLIPLGKNSPQVRARKDRASYEAELQAFVDRYNRKHGTDFEVKK